MGGIVRRSFGNCRYMDLWAQAQERKRGQKHRVSTKSGTITSVAKMVVAPNSKPQGKHYVAILYPAASLTSNLVLQGFLVVVTPPLPHSIVFARDA